MCLIHRVSWIRCPSTADRRTSSLGVSQDSGAGARTPTARRIPPSTRGTPSKYDTADQRYVPTTGLTRRWREEAFNKASIIKSFNLRVWLFIVVVVVLKTLRMTATIESTLNPTTVHDTQKPVLTTQHVPE